MNLVPHNATFALDQCIDAAWRPLDEPTDWDAVIASAGDIDTDALTRELRAGQPYAKNDLNTLRVFRLQTRIRIGLRCARNLPQYANTTCGYCGSRKASPVRLQYRDCCLHCAEWDLLVPQATGGRDWNQVMFDVASQSWGIAYVSDRDREKTAAIIVNRFPNYRAAVVACAAIDRFISLYNRVCGAGFEADPDSIVEIGDLFRQQLPMDPEQWRAYCTQSFRSVQTTESEPYAWELKRTVEDFYREQH